MNSLFEQTPTVGRIRVDLCIQSAWERDLTNIRGQQINALEQRHYYKELSYLHAG